jgi:hypothetical protein
VVYGAPAGSQALASLNIYDSREQASSGLKKPFKENRGEG